MYEVLNLLRDEAHQIAKDKGWHEPGPSIGESLALMHSELSEALECHRQGMGPNFLMFDEANNHKPEGIPSELADVIIRVFDFCGQHGVDIAEAVFEKTAFNKTRSRRHGNKTL